MIKQYFLNSLGNPVILGLSILVIKPITLSFVESPGGKQFPTSLSSFHFSALDYLIEAEYPIKSVSEPSSLAAAAIRGHISMSFHPI